MTHKEVGLALRGVKSWAGALLILDPGNRGKGSVAKKLINS